MKKSTFFADFKAFISKGNVLDMAVGVVIGAAFGKIVTALVENIITPLLSILTGKINLTDLKWVISEAVLNEDGTEQVAELALKYGAFIQSIIDFLIIALCIFIVLRAMTKAQKKIEDMKNKKNPPAPEEEKAPEETELSILKEIRDSLKKDEPKQ